MINERLVSKLLLTTLKSTAGLPAVVTEGGREQSQGANAAYVKEWDLSGDTYRPALSDGCYVKHGVYQVDVCTPKKDGKWKALDFSSLISAKFAVGVKLVEADHRIIIKSCHRLAGREDETHYIVSLSIDYMVIA